MQKLRLGLYYLVLKESDVKNKSFFQQTIPIILLYTILLYSMTRVDVLYRLPNEISLNPTLECTSFRET